MKNSRRRWLLAGWAVVIAAPALAQTSFKLQTPTALAPATGTWSFVAMPNGDLAAVQRSGSKGQTEIHILSASDKYQRFALQVSSALPVTDSKWDFVALANRDILAVNRAGSSGKTEVHILDSGKHYGAFKLQVPTALAATDAQWSFGANQEGDLVAINRRGAGGKTEVQVLDGPHKYSIVKLQGETALHATDASWDFGVLANGDIVAINRRGASGKTEVHVLDAAAQYKTFKLQSPTALAAADDSWRFAVRSNGDVFAVLTANGASGKTELHIVGSVKGDVTRSGGN